MRLFIVFYAQSNSPNCKRFMTHCLGRKLYKKHIGKWAPDRNWKSKRKSTPGYVSEMPSAAFIGPIKFIRCHGSSTENLLLRAYFLKCRHDLHGVWLQRRTVDKLRQLHFTILHLTAHQTKAIQEKALQQKRKKCQLSASDCLLTGWPVHVSHKYYYSCMFMFNTNCMYK